MTFIYELHPYSLEIYRCAFRMLSSDKQTYRHDPNYTPLCIVGGHKFSTKHENDDIMGRRHHHHHHLPAGASPAIKKWGGHRHVGRILRWGSHKSRRIERGRRENRGAKWGREWGEGIPLPSRLEGMGERCELPQRSPGRSPDRQRIFGIFKVHRTLLV